jgi:hypothetical protein
MGNTQATSAQFSNRYDTITSVNQKLEAIKGYPGQIEFTLKQLKGFIDGIKNGDTVSLNTLTEEDTKLSGLITDANNTIDALESTMNEKFSTLRGGAGTDITIKSLKDSIDAISGVSCSLTNLRNEIRGTGYAGTQTISTLDTRIDTAQAAINTLNQTTIPTLITKINAALASIDRAHHNMIYELQNTNQFSKVNIGQDWYLQPQNLSDGQTIVPSLCIGKGQKILTCIDGNGDVNYIPNNSNITPASVTQTQPPAYTSNYTPVSNIRTSYLNYE